MTHLGPRPFGVARARGARTHSCRPLGTSISCAPISGTSESPHGARCGRRVPAMDVGCRGDEDADDVVGRQRVAGEQLVQQRVHPLLQVVDVVDIESGGAAKRTNGGGHGGAG